MAHRLNPAVNSFAPNGSQQPTDTSSSAKTTMGPDVESRISKLENNQESLRDVVDSLKSLTLGLTLATELRKQEHGLPISDTRLVQEFGKKLDELRKEILQDDQAEQGKPNGSTALQNECSSFEGPVKTLPPHLRGKDNAAKAPEHVQNAVSLGTNLTTLVAKVPISPWKPHYIATLPSLSSDLLSKISGFNVVTFHPDFLKQTLGGTLWAPGQYIVKSPGPCILKNRVYLLLDSDTEPHLPQTPGEHGAKLTAFMNANPEDEFPELFPDGAESGEDFSVFVKKNGRYTYFGNYSQTRWSDKLDHDTMSQHVPAHVKEFWATELTSPGREEWLTKELQDHFFERPPYEGLLYIDHAEGTTVNSEEEVALNEKVDKDIRKYIKELRQWERESKMKTAMIKKDFILQAFENADADDPPALRLWWEYLECVGWKKDLYDLLVTMQSRNPQWQ